MACFRPLHGYVSKIKNANGKRNTVFKLQEAKFSNRDGGWGPERRTMRCGQCIGCRLEYSRQWAMRIMHEAKETEKNCFITLTYDTQHLPKNGELRKKDFQDFMKRLRKNTGLKLRFYHCGEYGENFGRPHYHACIFGADFRRGEIDDEEQPKIIYKKKLQEKEILLYDSPALQKIWKKGFVTVGELTFESAAYVARYVTKKINGKKKEEGHYEIVDYNTGEIIGERPVEYATMSRRPGIATNWFDQYYRDCYPKDYTTVRGLPMRPPRYYDYLLEKTHQRLFEKVKAKRKIATDRLKQSEDYYDHRLTVREKCQIITSQQLKRSYENDI